MSEMVYVTPAKGARVRQPERASAVMPEKGDWITRTVFYESLIASGDVVVADSQPPYPTAAKANPAPPAPVEKTK